MRKFAFFLPQYHEIPENNLWWGEGFTEWVKVKAAIPLFRGHMQPKVPLNNNYYCLLNKEIVEWQTNLMKEYGVDGLVYYHYYFDGKLLLDKPIENLLNWTDINQTFCFCWANHSWIKSWEGKKEVLIEQKYGGIDSWEKHFLYLLPFFKDQRYEKKDNKPIFMIFNSDFKEKKEMFNYFDQRCKENGFDGIFVIETYKAQNWPNDVDAFLENRCTQCGYVLLREATVSNTIFRKKNRFSLWWFKFKLIEMFAKYGFKIGVRQFDGNKLYDIMIHDEPKDKIFSHSIFFEWDNTPRHGMRGFVINPPSYEKFMEFINSVKNDEYLFINAWNEWAEGMMLEPTQEKQYHYLEWIKSIDEGKKFYC